ncbi:MAG: YlmH/Sll1252 family protein [Ruminococcus sp.]|nr:YlmH/Sll1252 family protein [Ruminococcus sp.]MCM1392069.1 YlmH/Sll1252 family protein [Ruminococcus sp.]
MTDDQILVSHARDLKTQCADNSMITNTQFLDLRQKSLLLLIEKEQREFVNTFYYGGYADAERTVVVFVPRFFDFDDIMQFFSENEQDNPLALVRIEKDKFSALSHRDYLGSLMGLGIKREMIGDLLVDENGCYIPCIKSIAKYITENLTSVGRGSVKANVVSFGEISTREENFELVRDSVASFRLDNMVSAAFSLSRSSSVQAIEKGIVYVNGVQIEKSDYRVLSGDKLVLRGKGKAVFAAVNGESKKGRLHVEFKRYK